MASDPITSWQIDGETVETVTEFMFLGSKITADGDHSHEIKRHLLLRRKTMTNLDSILKSRDLASKDPSSQSYGFSSGHVWIWELDYKASWASKELMLLNCGVGEDSWESLGLQGDQTSQSWRKSVLNIYWEALMLKLKLQYFGHLMWRTGSLEKTQMLGKTEGWRRRGQ